MEQILKNGKSDSIFFSAPFSNVRNVTFSVHHANSCKHEMMLTSCISVSHSSGTELSFNMTLTI